MNASRPVEHRLVAPTPRDRLRAGEILEGRYELPRVPDLVAATRILDVGAGVGAFAAWCHYLWPHAWIDCYERNEERAGYVRQNAPPGTAVHVMNVTEEIVRGMPRADVVRVAGLDPATFLNHYNFVDGLSVLIYEWRNDYARQLGTKALTRFGMRPAGSRVDDLGHGCEVWIRTAAEHERASGQNIVFGGEPLAVELAAPPPTFALGIPHTPWVEERRDSVEALLVALNPAAAVADGHLASRTALRLFTDRAPNWQWAGEMWQWGAEQPASHFVTLQDDARVSPVFWEALSAMVRANPDAILGLEAVHPAGPELARRGLRWYSTCAWLIGVGYVIPKATLLELLAWRKAQPAWRIRRTNEDTLINDFCGERRIRVFHPVPTIIDHDTDIPSTYDNDEDPHRRPTVRWHEGHVYGWSTSDLTNPEWWSVGHSTKLELPNEAT